MAFPKTRVKQVKVDVLSRLEVPMSCWVDLDLDVVAQTNEACCTKVHSVFAIPSDIAVKQSDYSDYSVEDPEEAACIHLRESQPSLSFGHRTHPRHVSMKFQQADMIPSSDQKSDG